MRSRKSPYTIRLNKNEQTLVKELAARHGIAEYQARHRVFERGLEAIFHEATTNPLVELLARQDILEALLDRTLFTAACAYVFAANAAAKGTNNTQALNQALSAAATEAYHRQLEIARGER